MAAETTHNTTNSVPGSLMDAPTKGTTEGNHQLSGELKNYKTEEDKQTGQEFLPEAPEGPYIGPPVSCKMPIRITLNKKEYKQPSSESEEVTILQEDQSEVSKVRKWRDADLFSEEHKNQSRDTTSQQGIEDNKTPKELGEFNYEKAVTSEENSASQVEISITLKVKDSNSKELDVETTQEDDKGSVGHNRDETVAVLKEEASSLSSDNEVKVYEDAFKVLKDGPQQEHQMSQSLKPNEGQVSLQEIEGTFKLKESGQAASDQGVIDINSQTILQGEAAESSFSLKDAIAQNIQQGELLLYRLHLVQQNQELQQVLDGQPASNTAAMVMTKDTMENVTMMPDTEGKDDGEEEGDLSLKEETTGKKECEEEPYQTEGQSEEVLAETRDHKEAKMEKGVSDDDQSDSGVSVDFFPGRIQEFPSSYSQNIRPAEETPIQREIRQGLEREKTLCQSRGLNDWGEHSQELVEIPVKRSLGASEQSSGTNFGFDAEKRLAKRKMLQDINQEAKKEQALKNLGKVSGLCSMGHAQDLKERKTLFDALRQCKSTDTQGSSRCKKFFSSSFTAGDAERLAVQGDSLPFVSVLERTRSLELFTVYQFKDSSDKVPDTDWQTDSHEEYQKKTSDGDATHDTQSESIRLSSSSGWGSETMPSNLDYDKEDEEGSILKRQNPFFQLRPALSLRPDVEIEIKEAIKREEELRRLRSRLYGGQENNLGDKQEGNTQPTCVESSSTVTGDDTFYVQSLDGVV
ncbi:hypothetical protein NFI96_005818 [Prochilodus magdalenae]|nr:hypothetical protein NFI96_005818 [Prochilodus magdalenae]